MITPLIVLALLLGPLLATRITLGPARRDLGGLLGLFCAFVFFGVGHFAETEAMIRMLPDFVPARRQLVLATGVLELMLAAGFLVPATRRLAGLAAIAVLIGFFPANIYAALNHTGMGGHVWGPEYLLIRVPLQVLLVGWTLIFALRWSPEIPSFAPHAKDHH